MKELNGKTAIISGGAEGIGLAIAEEVGRHGMNVVIADINEEQLEKAAKKLEGSGITALALKLDVADSLQWENVAEKAQARFGKVHMLVNNAGVGGAPSSVDAANEKDWRWIVDVNLMGVVNGTRTIVPLIKEHGEGGWLINVASMAGFVPLPMAAAYSATKAAVVAMSECWHTELAEQNIHVSILCPGFIKTRINHSQRNKQTQYQSGAQSVQGSVNETAASAQMQSIIDAGSPPDLVGQRVVEALAAKELYILTHPNFLPGVKARFNAITDSFERAKTSPLLSEMADQKIPQFD
ncbi:MAG: SDR family NAD(P)-dependent oxidoreductase [Pseudomonadales bacterium]